MIPPAISGGYQSYESAIPPLPAHPLVFLLSELIETHKTVSLRRDRSTKLSIDMWWWGCCVSTETKNKTTLHIGRAPLFIVDRGHRIPIDVYIYSISARRTRNSIGIYIPCVAGVVSATRGNLIFPEIWNSARAFSRLDAQLKSNAFVHKSGKYRRRTRDTTWILIHLMQRSMYRTFGVCEVVQHKLSFSFSSAFQSENEITL